MKNNVEWTEELDVALAGLVASGAPYSAIGGELGVTPFSARYRAHKLGIAQQRKFEWRDEHEIELLKYISAGDTLANIAKRLGVSNRALRARAQELGVTPSKVNTIYPRNSIPRRFIRVTLECVAKWIDRGWLPEPKKIKTQKKGKYLYRYTREQLEAFLEVEEAWVSWVPDNLVDEDLREYAKERRAAMGWYWMSSAEVASHLGYAHGNKLIRRWCSDYLEWNGKLFIKSNQLADIEQAIAGNHWHRGTLAYKYQEPVRNVTTALASSRIEFLEQQYGDVADGIRALVDAAMAQEARE